MGADVIVIGGGVIGLLSAYLLAGAGKRVVLVDR
ncbi:FAD-dependent oxidoreductase, partial [Pseudomonas sp. Bi70]